MDKHIFIEKVFPLTTICNWLAPCQLLDAQNIIPDAFPVISD